MWIKYDFQSGCMIKISSQWILRNIISSPQLEILCIGLLHALWKLQGEISSRLQQFYETCLFTITVCCQTKLFVDKKSKQFKNKTRWKYVAEYGVCRQPQVLRRPTFWDLKKERSFCDLETKISFCDLENKKNVKEILPRSAPFDSVGPIRLLLPNSSMIKALDYFISLQDLQWFVSFFDYGIVCCKLNKSLFLDCSICSCSLQ